MTVKIVVCNHCGYEERIKVISREEATRERKPMYAITCSRCGSGNVRLHD